MKPSCGVALKEWAVVVRALGEGRQLLLFRKGGIREEERDFRVEEDAFLFFPTFEHQHPEGLQEQFRPWLSGLPAKTPAVLPIEYYATVEKVLHLSGPERTGLLKPYHLYSDEQIQARFDYKPMKPLYLLLLKVFRIPPVSIPNLPAYAGCTSWVRLETPVSLEKASPVLPAAAFQEKMQEIERITGVGTEAREGRPRSG